MTTRSTNATIQQRSFGDISPTLFLPNGVCPEGKLSYKRGALLTMGTTYTKRGRGGEKNKTLGVGVRAINTSVGFKNPIIWSLLLGVVQLTESFKKKTPPFLFFCFRFLTRRF